MWQASPRYGEPLKRGKQVLHSMSRLKDADLICDFVVGQHLSPVIGSYGMVVSMIAWPAPDPCDSKEPHQRKQYAEHIWEPKPH